VIDVDAALGRHKISPEVYGVAFASRSQLLDLNVPVNRWGGNPTTRYNWQVNADNRGQDWYFQSIAYGSSTPGEGPDSFIADAKAAGAQAMMTVPTVGWVARVGPSRGKLCSFSIAKYGPQQDADWQWFPDAGNGVRTNGQHVTGNDPSDANVAADDAFHQGWFEHLVSRWGTAESGGLRYYVLDNEPSIWFATHRDVHPEGPRMVEVLDKFIDYGRRIKAVDREAQIMGPEEWGWSGYFYSGFDQQWGALHGWENLPDRAAHGGADYLPWLLQQLRQHQDATGQRLLDVFTVHYYPQGGEFGNDTSAAMQARRNRSTRSLWDPGYVDETWIGTQVRLIPRLKQWVAQYYPRTRIGITEYNWGAEGHINGATAQADVLGIFGREGLDVAARWTTPDPSTPTYKAIKMYRNYDGQRSTFGETSISARVPNPDQLSAFAALRRRDGAVTVMVVNKAAAGSTPVSLRLVNALAGGNAQVWQLGAANAITRLADVPVTARQVNTTVPAPSITLFVIPAGRR
jgi:hypothetical protein